MQSVDQQIKESDGIIVGHFLRSKAIKLEDGSIATQMIFKMKKEIGMQSEFFGMDEIIVHYPGGTVGEETTMVPGAPSFVPGEKLVIMIKSYKDRFWGMNLGFGSFKVVNYGNEKLIVNSIFPKDLRVSQVKMMDFERKVRVIKGSRLKVVHSPTYPSEEGGDSGERMPASLSYEGKNRAIASKTEEDENNVSEEAWNPAWLVFLLAMMGGFIRFKRQREAK
ncbi:MAG: hypothetical protein ACLGHN_10490 [Bacteriovoracia bacterium]